MKRFGITFGLAALAAACSAGQAPGGGGEPSGGTTGKGTGGTSPIGASGSSGKGNAGSSGKGAQGGSSTGTGGDGTSGSGGSGNGPTGGGTIDPKLSCSGPLGNAALRLLTRSEFDNTINDIFPAIAGKWSDTLPSNVVSPDSGFDNDASAVVGNQTASALLDTAVSIGTAVTGTDLTALLPCAASAKDHACAQTFVEQFGRRLFRRSVTADESARYLTLFDSGLALSDFPTALKWVVAGMIQSPNAVYRSEVGTPGGDGNRTLDAHEIATELAYTFSGTTPSEELLAAADAAGANAPNWRDLAATLIDSDKGHDVVQHFFEAYLGYTPVLSGVKGNLADFTNVNHDMVEETRSFLKDLVLDQGLGLREVLTSPTTNPTSNLATFYSGDPSDSTPFPQPSSSYASVDRPAGQGVGILAQGSFLASHANGDASSPTQRGLFVFYKLLCQAKMTPPKGVPQITAAAPTPTTRKRYEDAHMQAGSNCKGCHQYFDSLGFAFESFDEGGRFRTQQNGENVDTASSLPGESGGTVISFTDEADLMNQLANMPEIYQCFTSYLSTFAFGSGAACVDATQIAALQTPLDQGGVGIKEVFAELVNSPNFTQRKAQ